MNQMLQPHYPNSIVYPERDGKPMADNTRQAYWILMLFSNLLAMYHNIPKVFVAADLLWYPVEGHLEINAAPDVLVVFGRDQYHRGSYQQWREENVPVTVVFEILPPGYAADEWVEKIGFYEDHGVEELYSYNPESNRLHAFLRRGDMLRRHLQVQGFVSPRLGIRFDLSGSELVVYRPDGRPFSTLAEVEAQRQAAGQRAGRLTELSRKARRGLASPEEVAELDRLEEALTPPSPSA